MDQYGFDREELLPWEEEPGLWKRRSRSASRRRTMAGAEAPSGRERKPRRGLWILLGMGITLALGAVITLAVAALMDFFYPVEYVPLPAPGLWTEEVLDESVELERAPLGEALTLALMDTAGQEPLTYQEIYTKCSSSVVAVYGMTNVGMSMGTGVVLTADGYIITNQHVIQGCYEAYVVLADERSFPALLVGADAQTDLAVLKIEADDLQPAEFGDSDLLTVGDEALAIGNPMGYVLTGTLTNGIISAINRDVQVNGYNMTLIQTTAALNGGNSGGALINIYGQVVGITNSKMMSTSTTLEGLGFAIPSTTVKDVTEQLTRVGIVSTHLLLGIIGYGTQGEEGVPAGVYVYDITPGSDAEAKGICAGDVITAADGTPVSTVDELNQMKLGLLPGDGLELTVWRDGEEFTVFVTLAEP